MRCVNHIHSTCVGLCDLLLHEISCTSNTLLKFICPGPGLDFGMVEVDSVRDRQAWACPDRAQQLVVAMLQDTWDPGASEHCITLHMYCGTYTFSKNLQVTWRHQRQTENHKTRIKSRMSFSHTFSARSPKVRTATRPRQSEALLRHENVVCQIAFDLASP